MAEQRRVEFSPEQLALVRTALGLRPGDPDPEADDVLVVLAARQVVAAEERRWLDGEPPP